MKLSHVSEITSCNGGGPKLSSPPYQMHRYVVRERFGGAKKGGESCLLCILTRTYLPGALQMGISPLTRNNSVKEGGATMHRSQFVASLVVLKKGAVQE